MHTSPRLLQFLLPVVQRDFTLFNVSTFWTAHFIPSRLDQASTERTETVNYSQIFFHRGQVINLVFFADNRSPDYVAWPTNFAHGINVPVLHIRNMEDASEDACKPFGSDFDN